jgi:rubrerythrin
MQRTETILEEIKNREEALCDFYLEAKQKVSQPICQKIFSTLDAEHKEHLKRIEEIMAHIKRGRSWIVDRWIWDVGQGIPNPLTKMSDFLEIPLCTTEELKWLNLAMEKEEEFFFFLDELVKQSVAPLAKRFYLSLTYESRGYYLLLLDTKDCLTHPDHWQRHFESTFLDGV